MTEKQALKAAKPELRALGVTVTYKPEFAEYRVNFTGGREATAYYTTCAQDALDTARQFPVVQGRGVGR